MTILDVAQNALASRVLYSSQETYIHSLLARQEFDHVDLVILNTLKDALSRGEVIRSEDAVYAA